MKSKKASHVGFVVSFVIFVTFVVFLYSYLQPIFQDTKDKEFLFNDLKEEIISYVSAEVKTISFNVNVEYGGPRNCINVGGMDKYVTMENIAVKGKDGELLYSYKDYVGFRIDLGSYEGKFFKIYNGDETPGFVPSSIANDCQEISSDQYNLGAVRTEYYPLEWKILEVLEKKDDRRFSREELDFPEGSEYVIIFTDSQENVIGEMPQNVSGNVYSEDFLITYLNSTLDINQGYINLRVW